MSTKIVPDEEFEKFDDAKIQKLVKVLKRDLGEFFDVHMDYAQKGVVSRANVVDKKFKEAEQEGFISPERLREIEEDHDIFFNGNHRSLYRKDFIKSVIKTTNDSLLVWLEKMIVEKTRPRPRTMTWIRYTRYKLQQANFNAAKPAWVLDAHINKKVVEAMEHMADCEDKQLGVCNLAECKQIGEVLMHNVTCEFNDSGFGTLHDQLERIFAHKEPKMVDKVDLLISKNIYNKEEFLQEMKAKYGLPAQGSWCEDCRKAEKLQSIHKRHCRRKNCRIPGCGFPIPLKNQVVVPVKIANKLHRDFDGEDDEDEGDGACRRVWKWCFECVC